MKLVVVFPLVFGVVLSSSLNQFSSRTENENGISLGMRGGKRGLITKFPYMAAVLNHHKQFVGAGVILNNNWILTSGFNAWVLEDILIRVGSNTGIKGGQLEKVAKKVIHDKYEPLSMKMGYNVAVLKLETPLKFNKKVKPIALGTGDQVKAGTVGVVSGFNDTVDNFLVNVKSTSESFTTCNITFSPDFDQTNFCTKLEPEGPCIGDTGDPFVVGDKVFGLFCGTRDYCPTNSAVRVYTDITQLVDWIQNAIKS